MLYLVSRTTVSSLILSSIVLFYFLSFAFVFGQEVEEADNVPIDAVSTEEVSVPELVVSPYVTEGIPNDGTVVGDFVVGPGKVDFSANPGESKVVEISLTNRTGEKRRFNLNVEDTAGSRDTDVPVVLLGDDRGPYSLKDYISFPHASFELEHNARARIPVTISIPADAEPGGLYGSVLINTVANNAVEGNTGGTAPQSAIIARIGTLFFITVPGDIERSGELTEFTTVPKQKFYQEGPINFGLLFENTGPMHLIPYGEIRIRNIFDEEVGVVSLDPWFVLPGALRLREVAWDREVLFGRYTATALVNRGYDDTIDERSYTFWVLPWKPIAGAFGAIFLVIFLIRTFLRKFEFKRK